MDKEKTTLRDLLKEARGERDRIRRNTPSNTFDLKMVIDSMIDSMERLEEQLEGIRDERIGMGKFGIRNRGYDPDSWYAGAKWACIQILGKKEK